MHLTFKFIFNIYILKFTSTFNIFIIFIDSFQVILHRKN